MFKTLNIKKLLLFSLLAIFITYYMVFSFEKIIEIVNKEYIFIILNITLMIFIFYYKRKLSGLKIVPYLSNLQSVPTRSTIIIFLIFQGLDYYYQDSFKDMIALWFTYWVIGVFAYLLTNTINLYKNFRFYKYESIKEYRL